MDFFLPLLAACLTLTCGVLSQSNAYGQCGGTGWSGATTCVSGYVCTYSNPYYSQCLPGTATSGPVTSATKTSTGSATKTTASYSTTATGGIGSPSTTLLPNYYWIRAVEAPYFHYYLQSNPPQSTGLAVMASYTTAGQFNVVGGNLVQILSSGKLLYAIVSQRADSTVNKLAVTWSTSPAGVYGTFAFSGDALQWTVSGISRPNNSAWLICENAHLYVNLGAYGYMTPAGCADATIHYYNGATAVS